MTRDEEALADFSEVCRLNSPNTISLLGFIMGAPNAHLSGTFLGCLFVMYYDDGTDGGSCTSLDGSCL